MIDKRGIRLIRRGAATALLLTLSACGGGGGGVGSAPTPSPAPTPTPTPAPTPTPTPTPAAVFDTLEYQRSTGLAYHGAITAYQAGASGAGVLVGVVDSGLADPDGELAGRISPLSRDFAGNSDYRDVSGHGTAVANVIAAARNGQHAMGVAWEASILALRTDDQSKCDDNGCDHPTSAIAAAIDHAWQNGARVINISLRGGTPPNNLLQAVSRATSNGTIIVIAAGNNESGQAPMVAPDALAQAIAAPSVGHGLVIIAASVNANDTVSSFSAGVSGFEGLSMAAIGSSVLSIDHTGTEYLYSGTSFAAPQIAGAAALLAQAFPNLSGKQIVDLLLSSARDVGAPGADARYGTGILNIAKAFAPVGTLSLAGSASALTTTAASLSPAMGDAQAAAISAVALDDYARAYRVDMTPELRRPGRSQAFVSALDTGRRHVDAGTAALRLALDIAPGRDGMPDIGPLRLTAREDAQARLISGTIMARLSPGASVALGLRAGLAALERRLSGTPGPSFLMAQAAQDGGRPDLRASTAAAFAQGIAPGLVLTSGIETGDMAGLRARGPGAPDPVTDRRAPYQSMTMTLGLQRRAFGLTAGIALLDERASALGARFSPMYGAQSARSLFARLGASAEPVAGFTLSANGQHGWTRAAAGGALTRGGSLASRSWSADMAGRDVLARGDLVGLRVSQPLRVFASHLQLLLPDRWDWENGVATTRVATLDLVPRGRQRDYELSYGRGIGAGWLGANLYLREQSGNVAAMPDDLGMALRWSTGF
jgi:hypothetical protein